MNGTTIKALVAGGMMMLGTAFTGSAQAADFDINFGFGRPRPIVAPAPHCPPVVERVWIPGRYEDRHQQVLVSPERYERVWHPAVTETRYDRRGRAYTVVIQPGHYHEVRVPARYETRCTKVWIPGYYKEIVRAPHGGPIHGGPVHGGPVVGGPVYGGPVHGGPVHGGPVYGRPVVDGPVYYKRPESGYVSIDIRK